MGSEGRPTDHPTGFLPAASAPTRLSIHRCSAFSKGRRMTHLLLLLCLSCSAVMHPSFRLAEKTALRQGGGTPRPLTQEHSSTSHTQASSPELTARMLSIFPPRAVTPLAIHPISQSPGPHPVQDDHGWVYVITVSAAIHPLSSDTSLALN